MAGSDGRHIYVLVQNGADIERFLHTLHERCWLHGFGWLMVGAGGQLLDRSLVDRMVCAPERLVFEGAPVLVTPLIQDQKRRRARAIEGPALDTVAACPPLRIAQRAQLDELRATEAHQLAPERAEARSSFIARRAKRIAKRTQSRSCRPRAARSSVRSRGCCYPIWCCPLMMRSFGAARSTMSWPIPIVLTALLLPTPWRA